MSEQTGPPEVFIEGADEDLYEVTLTLCGQCLNGEGGECHHLGCALWLNRAPDISLRGNPMVCYRPAPESDKT